MGGMAIPGLSGFPIEYEQYNTQYRGAKETIGWSWWDTVAYAAAGVLNVALFNVARATIDLSNMEIAGQLAAPKAFFCRAIRFKVKNSTRSQAIVAPPAIQLGSLDDLAQIINTGVLTFTIGQKIYGQWPLWMLPAGGGVCGTNAGSAADHADYANNGFPDPRAVYTLSKPLFIAPQINFRCDIFWPALAPITAATTISVILDGDLVRPVQ